jgi:hypothetical protein
MKEKGMMGSMRTLQGLLLLVALNLCSTRLGGGEQANNLLSSVSIELKKAAYESAGFVAHP